MQILIQNKFMKVIIMETIINQLERNIIIGSLLGDGSLSKYGRSKNAYYREHGCTKQKGYRQWKAAMLVTHGFRFVDSAVCSNVRSKSLPALTELFNMFYVNGVKCITSDNIKFLDHPIGLACLYMDDGTLVIDSTNRNNGKYLFPRIALYSLSFSKAENELLADHIKQVFNIDFKLKKRPDGKKFILELNKQSEIMKFINLVEPFVLEIPCMHYKIDISSNMNQKQKQLVNSYNKIDIANLNAESLSYSQEQVQLIIEQKKSGVSDKKIADSINKSYWGTVDKIRRLRKEGKI